MEPTSSAASSDAKQDGQRFYHAQPNSYQLIFNLSTDEMECIAHLDVQAGGTPPSSDQILAFLAADGISVGVSGDSVEQLLVQALPGRSATMRVAAGQPPLPGDDGKLEYAFCPLEAPPPDNDKHANDADGAIDFRSVQRFINVDADQEIGRIIPPGSGTTGKTVRGKPVPPPPGKPLQLKLGKNVRAAGDDGSLLIAEIHGRVKLDGDTIHVVEEYVVDGDVDFSVGNIRFNGFVEVRGDVLDGFQINASKGLKITGNVGNCRLISPGNIEFCGMDGQGKGSILCGGNITANFIHESSIECTGTLQIHVELINCNVRTRGAVYAGMVSGGSCIALEGIDAKKAGAPSGVKTRLHAGTDYHDLERLQELFAQLEVLHESISQAKEMDELNRLTTEKQRLTSSIVEVRKRRPPSANPKVNVRNRLYEGVIVQVGGSVEEFTAQLEGPLSLIENSAEGGLRQVALSELSVHADEVERSYLDDQQRRLAEQAAAQEAERAAAEADEAQQSEAGAEDKGTPPADP
jgi:hypothetical protein